MALTLAELQAQRDSILSDMRGESSVQLAGGGGVTWRPQAELESALQRIDAEIAAMQAPLSRQFKIQTSRGL